MGKNSGGAGRAGRQPSSAQARAERMQEPFKKGTFKLALNPKYRGVTAQTEDVTGVVLGDYGVYKTNFGLYSLTCIPTGERIWNYMDTQRQAQVAARFWHVEMGRANPLESTNDQRDQFLRTMRGFRREDYDSQGRLARS